MLSARNERVKNKTFANQPLYRAECKSFRYIFCIRTQTKGKMAVTLALGSRELPNVWNNNNAII